MGRWRTSRVGEGDTADGPHRGRWAPGGDPMKLRHKHDDENGSTPVNGSPRGGRAPDAGPKSPAKLGGKGLVAALKRTFKQFSSDNVTDWAAALTYYGVLSIFPGVLVLVSILGFLGPDGRQT